MTAYVIYQQDYEDTHPLEYTFSKQQAEYRVEELNKTVDPEELKSGWVIHGYYELEQLSPKQDRAIRALSHIKDAVNEAYHSATLVCCGEPCGCECCLGPEPHWPEWAEKVMDKLDPVRKELEEVCREIESKKGDTGGGGL